MISRKVIDEKEVLLLVPNGKLKFSLEVVIELKEVLEACCESLWGHIIWLFEVLMQIRAKHIPGSN